MTFIPAKAFFNIVGSIAVVLAIAGLFLPLLPTTPFLLLASACYLRGSRRMHHWLNSNRVLGPYIQAMEGRSGIPLSTKAAALLLMWASLAYSIYIVPLLSVKILLGLTGLAVSTYILFYIKTAKPQRTRPD